MPDKIKRNGVVDEMESAGLQHYHFDLFELFAVDEYNDYTTDPTSEIPDTALSKFQNAGKELRKHGFQSFDAFIHSYVLSTEGTVHDSQVRQIPAGTN